MVLSLNTLITEIMVCRNLNPGLTRFCLLVSSSFWLCRNEEKHVITVKIECDHVIETDARPCRHHLNSADQLFRISTFIHFRPRLQNLLITVQKVNQRQFVVRIQSKLHFYVS